jgi:hypothetical protein
MLTTASQPAAEPTTSLACAPPAQAQQDSGVSGVVSTCILKQRMTALSHDSSQQQIQRPSVSTIKIRDNSTCRQSDLGA